MSRAVLSDEEARAPDQRKLASGAAIAHDSAYKHTAGQAVYVDDIAAPAGCLSVFIAYSDRAHAEIVDVDLAPVRAAPDVVAVLTASEVPGTNDVGPIVHDEPLFAIGAKDGHVHCVGQALFAVVAESESAARAAASLAVVEYKDLPALLSIEDAIAAQSFIEPPMKMSRGDARGELASAPHRRKGVIEIGGQEHFYLEGQAALALPGEDGDVIVHSSTQHPTEIQHKVAEVLGVDFNAVTVDVRRMGGGFGGKETNGNLPAAVAALAAKLTGRAAKVAYDRDDDMIITGKRHGFRIRYDVAFDDAGRIHAIDLDQAANCGWSTDLSLSICDRAMFHADNCYFLPHVEITSYRCKTNTVSNTAFRGFGGPQGMVGIERIMDEIAFALGKDPLDVRRVNFYAPASDDTSRNVTPYHMQVEDCVIGDIVAELEKSSDYAARRRDIALWNKSEPVFARGIALTPVKFGISFTATHLNQAAALIHIYTDGSIHLNHGGTEMGQGLYTKVAQLVADEFGVDLDRIKITAANTGKAPNTSPTAASSGTDLNGMAALVAARKIKQRLAAFFAEQVGANDGEVVFQNGSVRLDGAEKSFDALVREAYMARVSLSANGFYKTPKIQWDRKAGRGRPFYYFAYGAAVSEVVIDKLTGEYRLLRTDILHDVGKSINPAIDLGQIEGGFIQGAGWLTTEELWWDAGGRLKTHAPSTYKIPVASDRPRDLRINIWERGENHEETVFRSKAVGEPPLMLGISVLMALSDAIANATGRASYPALDAPATPERVLAAINHCNE